MVTNVVWLCQDDHKQTQTPEIIWDHEPYIWVTCSEDEKIVTQFVTFVFYLDSQKLPLLASEFDKTEVILWTLWN